MKPREQGRTESIARANRADHLDARCADPLHVDKRFATDDDHGRISPEPRVMRLVGITWCPEGERSPSMRRNSSSAAARPIVVGSWAIRGIPGPAKSATGVSPKP